MRIKTFYAKSMAEAMQEIKAALGPDALLLSSREIPNATGIGGPASGFEVVAASDSADPSDSDSCISKPSLLKAAGPETCDPESLQNTNGTDRNLTAAFSPSPLQKTTARTSLRLIAGHRPYAKRTHPVRVGMSESPFSDGLFSDVFRDLIASGVDEWLAHKLLSDAGALVTPMQQPSRSALLRAAGHIAQTMVAATATPDGIPEKRVVAFMGPTGVGKTTTLAKLAARLALQQKKKTVLVTLDSYRIGAVEQLRTYAGLMGIPFRFVSDEADLAEAVREHVQRDCVLIDTAGRAPRDSGALRELAECLESLGEVERHLVLSATTKPADIRDAVDRFAVCRPDHLLFTKLDETSTLGPILNEVVRTRKSMSYYSDGQRVPEDLHSVPAEQIVNVVLHQN